MPDGACVIDFEGLNEEELVEYTTDYYPLVIVAEPIYVSTTELPSSTAVAKQSKQC